MGRHEGKGREARPKTIIEVLKRNGITVASPQVSMVLKRMGFRPRRRRKAGKVARQAVATAGKPSKVKVEYLVKAKRIASQMGGVDKALAVLHALKDLEG